LGNAGIEVSRLCLGCMDFPLRLDEQQSARVVQTALDRGVNFIDTADSYGRGKSEEVLGRILKGRRDEVILATKSWAKMSDRTNDRGCSRLHLIYALENSLRRLRTDYLDLYQLHHPDPKTPVEESLSTLDTLVRQGKLRYIGVSNHYAWQMAHMLGISALHGWEPLVSVQCRYNILDRAVENEIVPFVQRFNIAMITYGPLDRGILTGKYRRGQDPPPGSYLARDKWARKMLSDEVFDILDELQKIAQRYQIGTNQLAVAWLLSKPYVTSVIMGGSRGEHFEQLYSTMELKIDSADLDLIDKLSEAKRYRPFDNQPIVQGAPLALDRW
ncbi:MAG: aldo/keto reductase, partial [Phycisphaerae bacterium]|nr:aldo/keto reductase [Phycisphaerae bacterium]